MTSTMTMTQRALVLLVVLSAVAAAVPPARRFARQTQVVYCDPETPCAWSAYQDPLKRISSYIRNDAFCICKEGTVCLFDHENRASKVEVHTCKPPPTKKEES